MPNHNRPVPNSASPFPQRGLTATLAVGAFVLAWCGLVVGCGSGKTTDPAATTVSDGHDHDHDDGHDHDHEHDHADHHHDHPPHGPNGGHLAMLSENMEIEWALSKEEDQVVVYAGEHDDAISKIEMRYQLEGQEPKVFELVPEASLGEHAYAVKSPELLTAIHVGDAAGVKLVVTTEAGEFSTDVRDYGH